MISKNTRAQKKNSQKRSYSAQLETWEQDAYQGGFGEDWLTDVGEGVKHYAEKCEAFGKRPTFKGLMDHIRQLHDGTHLR